MKGKKEIKTFLIRYIYSWKKKYANITFTMLCMVQPSLKYIYIFSRSRSNPLPLCLLFANGLFTRNRIISIMPVFLRNLLSEETTFLPSLLWENFLDVIIELEKRDIVSPERVNLNVQRCSWYYPFENYKLILFRNSASRLLCRASRGWANQCNACSSIYSTCIFVVFLLYFSFRHKLETDQFQSWTCRCSWDIHRTFMLVLIIEGTYTAVV